MRKLLDYLLIDGDAGFFAYGLVSGFATALLYMLLCILGGA